MKIKSVLFILVFSLTSYLVNGMNDELVAQVINNHDLIDYAMRERANCPDEHLREVSALTMASLNIEQMRNMVDAAINFNPPAGLEDNLNIPNDITLTNDQTRLVIGIVFDPRVMRIQAQTFAQIRDSNHSFEQAMFAAGLINIGMIRTAIPIVLQQDGAADNLPQQ